MSGLPNLYIVGAPKCGTTTLCYWLSQHPEIFMPQIKEPHYYNFDSAHRVVKSEASYQESYSGYEKHFHRYAIDASVWYLYSDVAIKEIERATQRQAKYIVCLRDPVDMAVSLHQELFMNGSETEADFKTAWALQFCREEGVKIPSSAHEPKHLFYGDVCSIGKYCQKLMSEIHGDLDRIIFVDIADMRDSPQKALGSVFEFLGVDSIEREIDYGLKNPARSEKSKLLGVFFKWLLGLRYGPLRFLPSMGVLGVLKKANVNHGKRVGRVPDSFRDELASYFQDDQEILRRIASSLSGFREAKKKS